MTRKSHGAAIPDPEFVVNDPVRLLRLLQLTDSGFPTGAFTFSHGLEGLTTAGLIKNEADVAAVIAEHLREGFAGIECPATCHAWRAADARDVLRLIELDAWVDALKPVPVFRAGSVRTGRRLLESAAGVLTPPTLSELRERVTARDVQGHHAVVFGVVMAAVGVDEETAALALGAGYVNGLAAAAVRLGVIGQSAAQRIVSALHGTVARAVATGAATALDEMGGYMPLIDVAGLRHLALAGRVFAS